MWTCTSLAGTPRPRKGENGLRLLLLRPSAPCSGSEGLGLFLTYTPPDPQQEAQDQANREAMLTGSSPVPADVSTIGTTVGFVPQSSPTAPIGQAWLDPNSSDFHRQVDLTSSAKAAPAPAQPPPPPRGVSV